MTTHHFLSLWSAASFYLAAATRNQTLLTATWALAWLTSTVGIAFNLIAFQKLQQKYNQTAITVILADVIYHWIPLVILLQTKPPKNKKRSILIAIALVTLYAALISPCKQYFVCP